MLVKPSSRFGRERADWVEVAIDKSSQRYIFGRRGYSDSQFQDVVSCAKSEEVEGAWEGHIELQIYSRWKDRKECCKLYSQQP
jgi:hypothetical protein